MPHYGVKRVKKLKSMFWRIKVWLPYKVNIKFYTKNFLGPLSAMVLKEVVDIDLDKFYFMNTVVKTVAGISNCRITRCGYTGEDGFEV